MQSLSSVPSDLVVEGHEPLSGRYRDDLHVQRSLRKAIMV